MSKGGDSMLYWGSGSGPCMRAMIALNEKGFGDIPNKLLSFTEKEHKGEEVLKINPRGQLPTLKLEGVVINESAAICEYLESVYNNRGTKLLPEDKTLRAMVLQRKAELEANIKPQPIFQAYFKASEEQKKNKMEIPTFKQNIDDMRTELNRWEAIMKENGKGSYLVGKEFTMADIFLISTLLAFVRFGLDLTKFPSLKEYYERVKERESVQKAWPPHWKTNPPNMIILDSI